MSSALPVRLQLVTMIVKVRSSHRNCQPHPSAGCAACSGEKPFADHSTHQCVDQCPSGHAPNADKDCHGAPEPPCCCIECWCVADCSKIAETVAAASSGNSTASNGTSYSNTELLRSVQLLLDLDTQLQQSSKLTGSEKPYADHVLNQCVATCSSGHAPNSNNDCEGKLFVFLSVHN